MQFSLKIPLKKIFFLDRALDISIRLSNVAVWLGGTLTLLSAVMITLDVCARKLFNITLGGADEISAYVFAISISWAFAFTVLQRVNVRVDALYNILPVRISAFLDWLSLIALGAFFALLTFYCFEVVSTSILRNATANTPLQTPLWIPQTLWFLGFVWMCIVLILLLIRASYALVTGDIVTLKRICGARNTEEEALQEVVNSEKFIAVNTHKKGER